MYYIQNRMLLSSRTFRKTPPGERFLKVVYHTAFCLSKSLKASESEELETWEVGNKHIIPLKLAELAPAFRSA